MTIDIELWKFLLLQGGLALTTLAAWAWGRGERNERREYTKQLIDFGPRLVQANMDYAAALKQLTDTVLSRKTT